MAKEKSVARIIEILLDKYIVRDINSDERIFEATVKGTVKKKNNILVGDIVEIEEMYDKNVIINIENRKNELIRPPVSNIDNLIIVVSIFNPSPDYILLDKQIILCKSKNITPIICINKIDLESENEEVKQNIEYIEKVYLNLGIKIVYTSAKKEIGMHELDKSLEGKISAFSGNSGVGKSSITQILIPEKEKIEINSISEKNNKGRHTTKYVKLYKLRKDTYILDTPGFSSYELYDIEAKTIKEYYHEFTNCNCDYADCNHIKEDKKVCEVKRNVEEGKIDKQRYERYVYIYEKIKEKEDRKYK